MPLRGSAGAAAYTKPDLHPPRTTDHGPRTTDHGPRTTDHGPRAAARPLEQLDDLLGVLQARAREDAVLADGLELVAPVDHVDDLLRNALRGRVVRHARLLRQDCQLGLYTGQPLAHL